MSKKIFIKTFGCQMNEYDSNRIYDLASIIGYVWKKSEIQFISKNELVILLKEKFQSERGRINCSLREEGGEWRWLGIQYVIAEY